MLCSICKYRLPLEWGWGKQVRIQYSHFRNGAETQIGLSELSSSKATIRTQLSRLFGPSLYIHCHAAVSCLECVVYIFQYRNRKLLWCSYSSCLFYPLKYIFSELRVLSSTKSIVTLT